MNTHIEAPRGAHDALLNHRPYVLAAHAGLVDSVAYRLRELAADHTVSPREVFHIGVAALHAIDRSENIGDRSRRVEQIGEVVGDIALMAPNSLDDDRIVKEDDLGVLLQSRLREDTRNPLISLLISKGAITQGLREEFGLHIPDEAYEAFLYELNQQSGPESAADDLGAVGLLDSEKDTQSQEIIRLKNATTFEELQEAYKNHPLARSGEVDELYNLIAAEKILDPKVSFDESVKFYDNLKRINSVDGAEDESAVAERLHLMLDKKFLQRAATFADPYGDYSLLANLLKSYELKTDIVSEEYQALREKVDYFAGLAFANQFQSLKPEDLLNAGIPRDIRSTEQRLHEDAMEHGDYKDVNLDLAVLSGEKTPAELKELYTEIFRQTDDELKTKQIFIATVLDRLRNERADHKVLSSLARLGEMIDSPDIAREIAEIHDIRLVRHAKKLYDARQYGLAYNVLSSTTLLLEDGNPVVEEGRRIFYDSFRYYNAGKDVSA